MYPLNLPVFKPKLRKSEGKIYVFDEIRRKFIQLTPEEWVRQHFIHFLILNEYPKSLLSVERGLKYNQRQKRADILVFGRDGKPFLLIECKAPTEKITEKTLHQISVYNHTVQAKYIALTNGIEHIYAETQQGNINFINDLPRF